LSGEPTLTLGQTLALLSPELLLLVAGLLMMGVDALFPHQEEKMWPPYLALGGLAAALTASVMVLVGGADARVLAVLSVDPFALIIKAVAMTAAAIVVLASDVYIRAHTRHQGEFYALLLFSTLAICLLSGATNLVMIFLTFDFLSITFYILTGYLRDDPRSVEAATKYFLYGAAISAAMLYGMSWFYGLTGATDLSAIASVLLAAESALRPSVLPALILVAAGFAFKIGAVPFHQWAPDVYEGAPTPVAAFLSVGPKIAGCAILVRVLLTALPLDLETLAMDWRALLMALSALTMTVGNLVAIWQTNVKRLLAYSGIAQAGYILIGVVAASERGVTAVLLYLVAYAVTNLGVFAAVVAFSNQTGSDEIEDYAGLNERAPGIALALIICLLSLIGIPPTAGFIGKLWLFSAALEEGLLGLAVLGVINSVISVACYWKLIRAMYLAPALTEESLETSLLLSVAMWGAVIAVFVMGILPDLVLPWLQVAAQALFG
jgi:proton-translocating NADH-quinone oxidoreductase chain N